MTTTMWGELLVGAGMALLMIRLAGLRHPLRFPLVMLLAIASLRNFAWTEHHLHGTEAWRHLSRLASSLSPAFGFDLTLAFLGRRRRARRIRLAAYGYFAAVGLRSVVWQIRDDFPQQHDLAWRLLLTAGCLVLAAHVAATLAAHDRKHRDSAERAQTRRILAGLLLWGLLAATDLFHNSVLPAVPAMSSAGLLVMGWTVVSIIDDGDAAGIARRLGLPLVGIVLVGHLLLGRALAPSTAVATGRALILAALVAAATWQLRGFIVERQTRVAELARRGRFSAQLAHDLRNPVAALGGCLDVVQEERRRGHSIDEQGALIDLMVVQVGRLRAIVAEHERAAKLEPIRQPTPLDQLLHEVAESCAIPSPVVVEAPADLTAHVDRDLLARALDNLLENAADASMAREPILLRARRDGDWAVVSVEDRGVGMDPRIREHAFDDFFTTKERGSGLGLAFVRRIAEAHEGRASLDSRVGRGTVVSLHLPLPATEAAPLSSAA
ncbi:MAG: HAMP domain-containing sensor histidine kinase [Polyangiaceae bacterium]